MSGRQSAVICQRLNELLRFSLSLLYQYCVGHRGSAAWAAATPAAPLEPASPFRSTQRRDEKGGEVTQVCSSADMWKSFHRISQRQK